MTTEQLSVAPLGIDEPLVYWYDGTEVAFELPDFIYHDEFVYYLTERDAWIARERDCKREYRAVTPHPIPMTAQQINDECMESNITRVVIETADGCEVDSWQVCPR